MRHIYLFRQGKTNHISRPFSGPVFIAGFNMVAAAFDVDEEGALTKEYPADVVQFERLLYDGTYDITCAGINEQGVLASAPLLDACGCPVTLDACHNALYLDEPGIFRAIYEGEGRLGASVVFYQEDK